MGKLKYDKDQMRRVCNFAIDNESRKGTPAINDDGSPMTKDQLFKKNIDLFENPVFIKAVQKMRKQDN